MWKQSDNLVHRLLARQLSNGRPSTQLHQARKLYEIIVPSQTIFDIQCPDYTFRKFTNDGQYLIAFSSNQRDLIVFRFNWLSYCSIGSAADVQFESPPKSRNFESYFTQLYSLPLAASANEVISKDFFLSTENCAFGIFASSSGPGVEPVLDGDAVPGVPSIDKTKLIVVRLADGVIVDERVYYDDFIHLTHNMGVFMYEDLLSVLSVRFQSIYILQIRETGILVDVRVIGKYCQDDDELVINSQAQKEASALKGFPLKAVDYEKVLPLHWENLKIREQQLHIAAAADVNQVPTSGIIDRDVGLAEYLRGTEVSSQPRYGHLERSSSFTSSLDIEIRTHSNIDQQSSSTSTAVMSGRRPEYIISSRHLTTEILTADSHLLRTGSGSEVEGGSESSEFATRVSTITDHISVHPAPEALRMATFAAAAAAAATRHVQEPIITQEQEDSSTPLLCGIKQRLLAFIFRNIWQQDGNPSARVQQLKRFYYHFQHYADLVMWKVQFLDRHHLLIKFGSVDGVVSRSADASQQTAFFVVYNIETTEILDFQQNSSEDFVQLFENFADHFKVSPRYPLFMNYISSISNNIFLREQMKKQKVVCSNNKSAQTARKSLAVLPTNAQSQSPAVYFDQSLFHFDEKLISATERHKPCMEHPIKFISRKRPNTPKFKITPGTLE